MEPTPIEDPETRRMMEELRRHSLEGSYGEIIEQVMQRSIPEDWRRLWAAKMAHDHAMRQALWTLRDQEYNRRLITRVAWWVLGSMAAILLVVATQCTGPYGGAIFDDPDHYSQQAPLKH